MEKCNQWVYIIASRFTGGSLCRCWSPDQQQKSIISLFTPATGSQGDSPRIHQGFTRGSLLVGFIHILVDGF